jgi:hypothetical protein
MESEGSRQLPLVQLALLALGLGVVTGIGAVLFRDLIGLIHNLFFTGHALLHYDANVFTAPAPWGMLVILVPVLGAIGVTLHWDRSFTCLQASELLWSLQARVRGSLPHSTHPLAA